MWFVSLVARAAVPVEDALDAWYAAEGFDGEQALPWHLAQMEAAPDDGLRLEAYVLALAQDVERDGPAIRQLVERWAAERPDRADVRAARAAALALAHLGPGVMTTSLRAPDRGPWCAEAEALVADPPELAGDGGYRFAWWARAFAEACGWPTAAEWADRVAAIGATGEAGPQRALIFQLRTEGAAPDAGLVAASAQAAPWALGDVARAAFHQAKGDAGAVREALLAEAARLAASERAPEVLVAAEIYGAAERKEDEIAARERLRGLDPDASGNRWRLEHLRRPSAPRTEPQASEIVDPELRLASLGRRPPVGAARWDRAQWWDARYQALRALGRDDEALAIGERWWRSQYGFRAGLEFAALAVARGERLRAAREACDAALDSMVRPMNPRDAAEHRPELLEDLASAYAARAEVHAARGDREAAARDWAQSLALADGHPERHARLGLLYAAQRDRRALARDHLAAALAGGVEGDLEAEVSAALTAALAGRWSPGGAAAYAEAFAASFPSSRPEEAEERPQIDFALRLDGRDTTLAEIEGPVVVDLWATWCGPCKAALPHVDQLARRYAGRVTFLAVSVDDTESRSDAWLAKLGDTTFTTAWAGPDLMDTLHIRGIPAFLVLDGDKRLVGQGSGYGPGSTVIEELPADLL